MDEGDYFILEFLLTLTFLFLLFFFSLFESALNRLTHFDLKLLNEHHPHNKILNLLASNNLKVIIPLGFGIHLSLIFVFVLATHLVVINIKPYPLLWAFFIVVTVNFLFRQLIPQMLTHLSPDKKLLFLLPLFSYMFPILRFFSYPIDLAIEKVGASEVIPEEEKPKEVTDKEIQALIDIGKDEEVLEKEEGELVKSVLEFGDTIAREVMTPRSHIIAISAEATIREVKDLMVREKHSRIPVYQENLDQIIGVIYVRNLLTKLEEKGWDAPIDDLLIPPVFVSEDDFLSEVFQEVKTKRSWMVFVRNDYGGVSGLITIEDLLEEIVGDISDEDQTKEEGIIPQGKNIFIVSGNVSLYDLSEALELKLEDEDCQTIGGLITKMMGRIPRKNEKLEVSGLLVTVLNTDSRKITRLMIEKFPKLPKKV